MERKFVITSIFITLGVIAFLSGYLLTFNNENSSQTGSLIQRFGKNDTNSFEVNVPKTSPLSSRKFISFVVTGSEKIVAVDENGDVVEIDTANFRERVMAALDQKNILETLISPSGEALIYSYYDTSGSKKHSYFNFKKGESAQIPGDLRSAAFSPHGDQTTYLVSTEDGGELLISKGVSVVKRALKTRLGAALIDWPTETRLPRPGSARVPLGERTGPSPGASFLSIVSYDKNGYGDLFTLKESGELNKILSYQYDLTVKWSPSSERIIFSIKDETNSSRLLYKDIKNNGVAIGLDISANSSKCIWVSEEEVICGVKNQTQIKDEFYKVTLANGIKTLIATPSINLLTKELTINRAGDTIFVLNDIDDKLYALKLK